MKKIPRVIRKVAHDSLLQKVKVNDHESKVYLCLAFLLLGFLPVITTTFYSLREVVTKQRSLADSHADALILAERLSRESSNQFSLMPIFVLSGDKELLPKWEESQARFQSILRRLQKSTQDPDEQKTLTDIAYWQREHTKLAKPGISLRELGEPISVVHKYFSAKTKPIGENLQASIHKFVGLKSRALAEARQTISRTTDKIISGIILVSLLALLFIALITVLLVRLMREKRRADLEREKLFQQERHVSQVRKETVEVVSHDLKNPLAAVNLRLQLMRKKAAQNQETLRDVDLALRSIKGMEKLITDLLDHTKIEAGHLHLERIECDLAALVRESVERIEPLAREKSISLSVTLENQFPSVSCDPARMEQVFANLLGNAIKFTPPGGRVQLQGSSNSKRIVLAVRDTGHGIATEKLPRIFERFWQDKATAQQGTGLGLAIAKGIIEAHGGNIWAESRVADGTDFYISLPLATEAHDGPRSTGNVLPLHSPPKHAVFH